MLPESHNRAYQDFLTLLIEFNDILNNFREKIDSLAIKRQCQSLQQCFEKDVASLESQNLEPNIIQRWQSLQTEIKREFKLLTTSMLFLVSARQDSTRFKRLQSIKNHTTKLISYCQIMLNHGN